MFARHKDSSPKRRREKLTSTCLLAHGDVADDRLAVTWVDITPGGRQIPHNHPEVQVYVIVAGRGRMLVGEATKQVTAGELIYVPSGLMHGIENVGDSILSYISAANPAFDYTEAYDRGSSPLRPTKARQRLGINPHHEKVHSSFSYRFS